jgi:alanyl-tRNA synthetase
MTIRQVTSEEAATLPLRKEPSREGELRVIEIDDFDLTPCGGTHAKSTGEVGVIAVRSWERAKGLARIQFMAGIRVLADYRKGNRTARDVAALFSAGREDSPALVARLVEESKKLRHRVSELEEVACRVEAEELLKHASDSDRGSSPGYRTGSGSDRINSSTVEEPGNGPTIIAKIFSDRDADSLKHLALALIAHPNTIALLGSRDGETARLVFARSSDAAGDMKLLMRDACKMIDGRGGGRPDMAQGGGKNVEKLAEAIQHATSSL